MEIKKLNIDIHEIIVRDVLGKNVYLWIKDKNDCEGFIGFVMGERNLDGKSGINSIIDGIKNVKVIYQDYKERKKRDDKMRENNFEGWDWDYDNNPLYYHIVDCPERYGKDILSTVPYSWASEVTFADSYKDITVIENLNGDHVEYYSTLEVLEVLEKWKEALEKWNNPEERQKMIEEYEKNNQGKT